VDVERKRGRGLVEKLEKLEKLEKIEIYTLRDFLLDFFVDFFWTFFVDRFPPNCLRYGRLELPPPPTALLLTGNRGL
jgi:hypothetical protein